MFDFCCTFTNGSVMANVIVYSPFCSVDSDDDDQSEASEVLT